jgi:hypothetical protein
MMQVKIVVKLELNQAFPRRGKAGFNSNFTMNSTSNINFRLKYFNNSEIVLKLCHENVFVTKGKNFLKLSLPLEALRDVRVPFRSLYESIHFEWTQTGIAAK